MTLGYACQNMQLAFPQQFGGQPRGVNRITTGRRMIKRTFESKGVDYASEIVLKKKVRCPSNLTELNYKIKTFYLITHL